MPLDMRSNRMSHYMYMHFDIYRRMSIERPLRAAPERNSHEHRKHRRHTRRQRRGARPLGFWLRTVDALISREFAAAFDGEGVTRRDWMLLNAVSGDVEVPGFAERFARKGGKRLRGLEQRGWVEETGDGTWILTEEGAPPRSGSAPSSTTSARASPAPCRPRTSRPRSPRSRRSRASSAGTRTTRRRGPASAAFGPVRTRLRSRLGPRIPARLRSRSVRPRHPSRFRPEPPQGLPSRLRSGRRSDGDARRRRRALRAPPRAPRPRRLPRGRSPRPPRGTVHHGHHGHGTTVTAPRAPTSAASTPGSAADGPRSSDRADRSTGEDVPRGARPHRRSAARSQASASAVRSRRSAPAASSRSRIARAASSYGRSLRTMSDRAFASLSSEMSSNASCSIASSSSVQLARLDGVPKLRLEVAVPVPEPAVHGIAHRTRLRVDIRRGRGEEASAAEDALARVVERVAQQDGQPPHTARLLARRIDDVLAEDVRRRVHGRELQRLLAAEERRDAALAVPGCLGEPADGHPVESFDRGDVGGVREDGSTGGVAAGSPAVFGHRMVMPLVYERSFV